MKRLASLLLLAACAAAPETGAPRGAAGPVRIAGLQYWQGAEARRAADARCGAGGVHSTIRDRYTVGEWVFVGGCA